MIRHFFTKLNCSYQSHYGVGLFVIAFLSQDPNCGRQTPKILSKNSSNKLFVFLYLFNYGFPYFTMLNHHIISSYFKREIFIVEGYYSTNYQRVWRKPRKSVTCPSPNHSDTKQDCKTLISFVFSKSNGNWKWRNQ